MTPSSDHTRGWTPGRYPQTKLAGAAALTAITVVAGHVYGSAGPVEAVDPPTSSGAQAPQGLQEQLDAANAELERVAAAITDATRALADAEVQLAELQAQLADANVRAATAAASARQAALAVVAAASEVQTGQQQIGQLRDGIADLQVEVSRLVRAAYITGGESEQLALLLQAQDPADFLRQVQWLTRVSRGNNKALATMTAAQQNLAARLQELKSLEATARQTEAAATAAAEASVAAVATVRSTEVQLTDVVNQRTTLLAQANANRASLSGAVARLIERQRQVAAEQAALPQLQPTLAVKPTKPAKPAPVTKPVQPAPTTKPVKPKPAPTSSSTPKPTAPQPVVTAPPPGQSSGALVALKYALSKIGSAYTYAGVGPSYDCIGLVWRAWQVAGSKWAHGSVQDVAHSRWVRFISADQLRPGDLIMWSFWDGSDVLDHIGMIVDPRSGTFVHAESTSTGVRLSNWKRESFYQHPAAFGRVVS